VLLAIDTATQYVSLALHDGRDLLAEYAWHTPNNHTAELAPAVQTLLERAHLTTQDISAIAVTTGPGSYTGVRIGVAMAKGMAAARNLPLVGISSLDVLASGQPYFQGGLVAVASAGRGRIIAAPYRWRKGRWESRQEPNVLDWDALIASIDGTAWITGEINDAGHQAIDAARERGVPVGRVPAAFRLRRAGFLAEAAWLRLRETNKVLREEFNPAVVVPIYVKSKELP
jgi:tRNA threonylcarbamoyladenosine biosynthesis protein TsaB